MHTTKASKVLHLSPFLSEEGHAALMAALVSPRHIEHQGFRAFLSKAEIIGLELHLRMAIEGTNPKTPEDWKIIRAVVEALVEWRLGAMDSQWRPFVTK